jgi:protein-export membrane protein SecD
VSFRFNPAGGRAFGLYTAENIGNPFAIVLDDEVISAPVIQAHISGGSGIITGRFSIEESTNLAVLLRAGALPAGMTFLEERTIGPELGQDSIDAGRTAAVIAMAAGSTLTKTVQFEQILVLAWVPLLLATIHAVITSDRPWRAVAAMGMTT